MNQRCIILRIYAQLEQSGRFASARVKNGLKKAILCGWKWNLREARSMAKNQDGAVRARNGKIAATQIRVAASAVDGAHRGKDGFIRSSHSLSTILAKRLRTLAYEQQTSESSIIECALWLFFKNGSDADVLRLMTRAKIEPRRRRR